MRRLPGLVTLNGNDIDSIIQTLQNVGSAKVQGIDLEANFRQNVGPGRLDLNMSGTYMIKFDQTSPGGVVSHKVGADGRRSGQSGSEHQCNGA